MMTRSPSAISRAVDHIVGCYVCAQAAFCPEKELEGQFVQMKVSERKQLACKLAIRTQPAVAESETPIMQAHACEQFRRAGDLFTASTTELGTESATNERPLSSSLLVPARELLFR